MSVFKQGDVPSPIIDLGLEQTRCVVIDLDSPTTFRKASINWSTILDLVEGTKYNGLELDPCICLGQVSNRYEELVHVPKEPSH